MKKCTWCGKEFSDEATACDLDANPLERIVSNHSQPSPPLVPPILPQKPWLKLLLGVTMLVAVNACIAFASKQGQLSFRLGAASFEIIFPLLIALAFSIGRRFRNPRAWTIICLWVSVLLLLAKIGTLFGGNGRGFYNQGATLYDQRDYSRAASYFTRCLHCRLTVNPSRKDALLARGMSYAQIGEDAAAIADLREVLKLDPKNRDAADLLEGLNEAQGHTSLRTAPASSWPQVLKKSTPLTDRDVPLLMVALTDSAPRIRLEAVGSLEKLGPAATQALPLLLKIGQNDAEPFIRASAKAAIAKIAEANTAAHSVPLDSKQISPSTGLPAVDSATSPARREAAEKLAKAFPSLYWYASDACLRETTVYGYGQLDKHDDFVNHNEAAVEILQGNGKEPGQTLMVRLRLHDPNASNEYWVFEFTYDGHLWKTESGYKFVDGKRAFDMFKDEFFAGRKIMGSMKPFIQRALEAYSQGRRIETLFPPTPSKVSKPASNK